MLVLQRNLHKPFNEIVLLDRANNDEIVLRLSLVRKGAHSAAICFDDPAGRFTILKSELLPPAESKDQETCPTATESPSENGL